MLAALLASLTFGCAAEALRAFPARRAGAVAAVLAGALVFGGVVSFVPAQAIPVSAITVLHEGRTEQDVRHLDGAGVHAGRAYIHWSRRLAGASYPRLRGIVRNQVGLTALNAGLFGAIAWLVLGRAWAALLAVAIFVANPVSHHATFSETPATWLTTLTLAGVIGASAFEYTPHQRVRLAATLQMAVVLALCGLTREESAIVPAVALSVLLFRLLAGDARVTMVSAWLARTAGELARQPSAWLTLLGASWLWDRMIAGEQIGFRPSVMLHAVLFAEPTTLTLPLTLGLYLPTGLVALIVLGGGYALARGRGFALLPIAVLSLYRALLTAAHNGQAYYEIFRYLTLVMPALLVLALFGFHALEAIAARWRWPAGWRGAAVGALLFAMAATPGGPVHPPYDGWDSPLESDTLLSRNIQVEVRYLLSAMADHPECELVTRVTDVERIDGRARPQGTALVLFGGPQRLGPRRIEPAEMATEASGRCVLFYEGIDCHLTGQPDCSAITARRPAIDTVTTRNRWYSEPMEYGELAPQLRFALYRMDADPAQMSSLAQ